MGSQDERRLARAKVLMAASVTFDGTKIPVRVLNLSAHGALIGGEPMPPMDTAVQFRRSGVDTQVWIAWLSPPHAGINFDEPIDLKHVGPRSQGTSSLVIKDDRAPDFRRPGFRGNQMTAEERRVVEAWKSEQSRTAAGRSSPRKG